jgi:hypothetical protein
MESKRIISGIHKEVILPYKKTEAINRSNAHSGSKQHNDGFTFKIKSRRGLSTENRSIGIDMPTMEFPSRDRFILQPT